MFENIIWKSNYAVSICFETIISLLVFSLKLLSIHAFPLERIVVVCGGQSEWHGLFVKLVEIFIVYADVLQFLYFGLLDVLDLVSLHVDFLSHFSAFLQVVQSILLLDIFVISNLTSDLVRMFNERLFSIFFDFPFLQLDLFLFLDLVHVVFSLDASLLGQGRGFFLELFLSCFFKIGLDSLPLGLFKLFSFSRLSLTLLKGSLCSQSVDFSLSVSSLFLEFS